MMLYVVPTPIGNLGDITLRAIDILREVDIILTEDTRTSGKLLKHLSIDTKMWAFHAFNEHQAIKGIIHHLLSGQKMALISDAGTPGISDPGYSLVNACIDNEIKVVCLPGATAFVPALVMSGLSSDSFYFEGFLPHKKGRQTRWNYLSSLECTFILYESPHRLIKCIEECIHYLGEDRKIVVVREVSKVYEDVVRLPAKLSLQHFIANPPKGEIVVVIEGNSKKKSKKTAQNVE